MDEFEWIKHTKKALLTFAKVFMGTGMFFAILSLISSKGNMEELKEVLIVCLLIGVVIPSFLCICFLIIHIFSKILNAGRTVISFDRGYVRDLPKHCSPAICSLIYDLKIDIYKDYTATILYLCVNKYLELIKEGDTYKLKIGKQKDLSNLGRCEKYVLDIIEKENKFDADKFKEEIVTESQEKGLIKNKKYSNILRIILCLLIIVIALIIVHKINKMIFLMLSCFLGMLCAFGPLFWSLKEDARIVDTRYKRTKDGRKIAILLKGLKRYIAEYTLIQDKEIDYIQILEDYIPYALSLDEAHTVEVFVQYHDQYRDLIYNRHYVK